MKPELKEKSETATDYISGDTHRFPPEFAHHRRRRCYCCLIIVVVKIMVLLHAGRAGGEGSESGSGSRGGGGGGGGGGIMGRAWHGRNQRLGKYEVGRTLGEGNFGKVKYARNMESGQPFAIKILEKKRIRGLDVTDQVHIPQFLHRISRNSFHLIALFPLWAMGLILNVLWPLDNR